MADDFQVHNIPIPPRVPTAPPSLRCIQMWIRPVMAASALDQSIPKAPLEGCLECSRAAEKGKLSALDEQMLCRVFCCCNHYPYTPPMIALTVEEKEQLLAEQIEDGGVRYKQECVKGVLGAADRNTAGKNTVDGKTMGAFQSRYKPEISYNMRPKEGHPEFPNPYPFMHRDANGQDTTEPSHYWLTRAAGPKGPDGNYVPNAGEVSGRFVAGKGQVRRPDVVIVDDPTKPPTQSNIQCVVEMKFRDKQGRLDRWRDGQEDDYEKIGGGKDVEVLTEERCGCEEDDKEYDKVDEEEKRQGEFVLELLIDLLLQKAIKWRINPKPSSRPQPLPRPERPEPLPKPEQRPSLPPEREPVPEEVPKPVPEEVH